MSKLDLKINIYDKMQGEKGPQRAVGEGLEAEALSSQGPRAVSQEVLATAPSPAPPAQETHAQRNLSVACLVKCLKMQPGCIPTHFQNNSTSLVGKKNMYT